MHLAHNVVLVLTIAQLEVAASSSALQQPSPRVAADSTRVFPLETTAHLSLVNARATATTYRGRKAVRLLAAVDSTGAMALVEGADLHDGTIELWVAGTVRPDAADTSVRGFVGVAFRAAPGAGRYENIYLRPTNGRAGDQLRRNHAVQYESMPDYPWYRLRQETPGRYESYVDLEPGVWTRMRVVVTGARAELYVNDAAQPCLIVNDLKLGDAHGLIGLWIGPGTEAYFAQLRLSTKPS